MKKEKKNGKFAGYRMYYRENRIKYLLELNKKIFHIFIYYFEVILSWKPFIQSLCVFPLCVCGIQIF